MKNIQDEHSVNACENQPIKVTSKPSGCEWKKPKNEREQILSNPEACCSHGSKQLLVFILFKC